MLFADLPPEILFQIISYLDPPDLSALSLQSRKLKSLAHDATPWKSLCFASSHAERRRRHANHTRNTEPRYGPLMQALYDLANPRRNAEVDERKQAKERSEEEKRVLANWDPEFPGERIDYREEYVQRKGKVCVSWFEGVGPGTSESLGEREGDLPPVTGVGILYCQEGAVAERVVAALEDGSVCVWELEEQGRRGRIVGRSKPGLLTGMSVKNREIDLVWVKGVMTETGAVECLSVNSMLQRAYFAVGNEVVEVDLRSLQVRSREIFPFAVTALSEARNSVPLTVGTNNTIHLYDARDSNRQKGRSPLSTTRMELIGGSPMHRLSNSPRPSSSYATLAQPGPLSILHTPTTTDDTSIWVAGRFTSLLNYDRRVFPRLRGHVHSGARIACLRSTPHPFIPRELSLMGTGSMSIAEITAAKAQPGMTLLAAGEYKGKGSLEMYGLGSVADKHPNLLNRQTASGSKLLSVASHSGKIVYSDGDGNVRWVERDGFSPVRKWNLNEHLRPHTEAPPNGGVIPLNSLAGPQHEDPDDIVQLLLPTRPMATSVRSSSFGEDNLVVWTGDGKVGVLGFGREKWQVKVEEEEREWERESRREERSYDVEMGQALRAHANELNWLRGLGLG